jgi:hypothetical protein
MPNWSSPATAGDPAGAVGGSAITAAALTVAAWPRTVEQTSRERHGPD